MGRSLTIMDITTLPALARVLHTDLNTLLSLQEDLTAEEIARFTDDLDRLVREKGYEAAFQRGMDEIHQYPNCEALLYSVIFYLDGARFLYGVPNPDNYTDRLMPSLPPHGRRGPDYPGSIPLRPDHGGPGAQ